MASKIGDEGYSRLPFAYNPSSPIHAGSFVHGKWVQALSKERFDIVDPGTGSTWASCADNGAEDVDAAVQSAQDAFAVYSRYLPRQRASLLLKWHMLIEAAKDDLSAIVTYETGKPLSEAKAELDYSLGFTWWFAGEAERIQGSISVPSTPDRRVLVIKQPIGVCAALVPWNFPIAMILRKAGAALAAGCSIVIKPSPETPLSCLALAHLAIEAGFPPGCVNVLTTSLAKTPTLSEALCVHPLIKKVTFTGSTRVGKLVAGLCAKNLKKCTLELGGNCPAIVFDDADLEQAVQQIMALKWRHAGQACVTANRVFVQSGIHDRFKKLLVEKTKALKVGHGMSPGTSLGALTTLAGLSKAEAMVADAIEKGANLLLGTGKRLDAGGAPTAKTGYFLEPVVLDNMHDDMMMSREESFAPLCGIFTFESEAEVVARANDTAMGLASYVFTKDADRLWRMFEALESGMVGLVSVTAR